jgi:hypothetical protein
LGIICYYVNMMNKHENITLEVYREGEIDEDYYKTQARTEQLYAVLSHMQAAGAVFATVVRNIATTMKKELKMAAMLVELDYYDYRHGTHLRREYIQTKRAREISHLRAQFQ